MQIKQASPELPCASHHQAHSDPLLLAGAQPGAAQSGRLQVQLAQSLLLVLVLLPVAPQALSLVRVVQQQRMPCHGRRRWHGAEHEGRGCCCLLHQIGRLTQSLQKHWQPGLPCARALPLDLHLPCCQSMPVEHHVRCEAADSHSARERICGTQLTYPMITAGVLQVGWDTWNALACARPARARQVEQHSFDQHVKWKHWYHIDIRASKRHTASDNKRHIH